MEFADEPMEDFTKPGVLDKYRAAALVATKAMAKVVEECQAGKRIVDICKTGDALIVSELTRTVRPPTPDDSKDPDEAAADALTGVAFPTCVSVNTCAGHYSPLSDDTAVLVAGDVAKIDLGVHVGGFPVVLAQTVVVPGAAAVVDKRADAIAAAYMAFQCVARSLRPGVKNTELSELIERVAKAFGVSAMEGVLSHNLDRFVIDGGKVIMNRPTTDQRVEETEVAAGDAWAIDVVMSTGEGRARDLGGQRTTVFRHNPDNQYLLKMKASRATLAEITQKFPAFPFTLRALADEKRAKLGVSEMVSHQLLDSYPVLHERQGEVVVQFKGTFLVGEKVTAMLAGPAAQPQRVQCAKAALVMAAEGELADAAVRAALARPLAPVDELAASLGKKKKKAKSSAAAKKRKAAAASAKDSEAPAAPAAEAAAPAAPQ